MCVSECVCRTSETGQGCVRGHGEENLKSEFTQEAWCGRLRDMNALYVVTRRGVSLLSEVIKREVFCQCV